MSNVKIKKSVLQSIIKKSLNELHNDPSRRLTIGPDTGSLPSMLPLSPSDRMSTQLETERPPVEDPEYIPANSKELGSALQALAEMVPTNSVGDAYSAFQKTIEEIELQNADNIESQLESINRKNRRFDALLREAPKAKLRGQGTSGKSNKDPEALAAIEKMKDYKPVTDQDPKTRKEQMVAFAKWLSRKGITTPSTPEGFSDKFKDFMRDEKYQLPGRDDVAAMMRDRSNDDPNDRDEDDSQIEKYRPSNTTSVYQILLRYPEVCDSYRMGRQVAGLLSDLVDGRSITKDELETFLKSINDNFLNDSSMKKAWEKSFKGGINDASILADFIRKFSDENEDSEEPESEEFQWQSQSKKLGFAAASGLRQSFIRDIQPLFFLKMKISNEDDDDIIKSFIDEAFEEAFNLPQNQEFLAEMLDEEAVEAIKKDIEDGTDLSHYQIYRNFAGSVMSESLADIGELNFKGTLVNGKRTPGRQIATAFMQEFGKNLKNDDKKKISKLSPSEEEQLHSMSVDGTLKDTVEETLNKAQAHDYRSLLNSSSVFAAQDADAKEFGTYNEPATSSLKKHRAGTKPPEIATGEYVDDSPEGREFAEKIKSSDRAARKFKSTVPKNK